MTVEITLTPEQAALATEIGYAPAALCQLEIDNAQPKWQAIADAQTTAHKLKIAEAVEADPALKASAEAKAAEIAAAKEAAIAAEVVEPVKVAAPVIVAR